MRLNQYVASAALMALTLSACGDDDPVNNVVPEQPGNEQPATPEEPEQPTVSEVSGEVEGICAKALFHLLCCAIFGYPCKCELWIL